MRFHKQKKQIAAKACYSYPAKRRRGRARFFWVAFFFLLFLALLSRLA